MLREGVSAVAQLRMDTGERVQRLRKLRDARGAAGHEPIQVGDWAAAEQNFSRDSVRQSPPSNLYDDATRLVRVPRLSKPDRAILKPNNNDNAAAPGQPRVGQYNDGAMAAATACDLLAKESAALRRDEASCLELLRANEQSDQKTTQRLQRALRNVRKQLDEVDLAHAIAAGQASSEAREDAHTRVDELEGDLAAVRAELLAEKKRRKDAEGLKGTRGALEGIKGGERRANCYVKWRPGAPDHVFVECPDQGADDLRADAAGAGRRR